MFKQELLIELDKRVRLDLHISRLTSQPEPSADALSEEQGGHESDTSLMTRPPTDAPALAKPSRKTQLGMISYVSAQKDKSIGLGFLHKSGQARGASATTNGVAKSSAEDDSCRESTDISIQSERDLMLLEESRSSQEGRRSQSSEAMTPLRRAWSRVQLACMHLMNENWFVNLAGIVIVLNVVFIGADIDFDARHWDVHVAKPPSYKYIDVCFFAFFAFELAIRVIADGLSFFTDWHNWMDFLLVSFQGSDVVHELRIVQTSSIVSGSSSGLTMLRMLRIGRMTRLLRLLRVLTMFEELSSLVDSMAQSFKSLVWVLVMVSIVTYAVGVVLTLIVSEFRHHSKDEIEGAVHDLLDKYYGSVGVTMLVLYEIMSTGVEWGQVMDPAVEHISPYISVIFLVYTSFTYFAMMNVVTSYFVENTLRAVEESRSCSIGGALWDAFQDPEGHHLESISAETFYDHLHTPQMMRYLASLDISPETCEEKQVFEMLCPEQGGELQAEDLIRGCMRLRGSAKQIDFHCFAVALREEMGIISDTVSSLQKYIKDLIPETNVSPRRGQ